MADTGRLYGGGHPGLAFIALLPFVEGCDDDSQGRSRRTHLLGQATHRTLLILTSLGTILVSSIFQ